MTTAYKSVCELKGNVGPARYNRTQAQGANMLAKVLKQHSRGTGALIWRAFVYGNSGPIGREDLARQAFDTFRSLDG